jgi:CheY-like chemotaxis protein
MKTKKRPTVFLVENHEDTLESIQNYLELQGYDVLAAKDVKTALAQAKVAKFDVLVSDISLPDGDGWALLRQLNSKKAVKAIAMSGFGMKADLAKSKAAGFSDHLIKPFQGETLEAAIQKVIPEFFEEDKKSGSRRSRSGGSVELSQN